MQVEWAPGLNVCFLFQFDVEELEEVGKNVDGLPRLTYSAVCAHYRGSKVYKVTLAMGYLLIHSLTYSSILISPLTSPLHTSQHDHPNYPPRYALQRRDHVRHGLCREFIP